jgi:hypothetical protein
MKELASGQNFRRFFNRSRVCLEIALIVLVLTIGSIDRAAPSLFNANRTREIGLLGPSQSSGFTSTFGSTRPAPISSCLRANGRR